MIAYLKGKTVYHGVNYLVVETGGVGYKVFVVPALLDKKEIELYIYHNIREDADDLFGFATQAELEVFELLLGVSGVGPRVALSLIAGLGAQKILSAISRGETTIFKAVSGIGNKVAAKIVVELRNKVAGDSVLSSILPEDDETVGALMALGFRRQEILPYLKEIPAELKTVQEKVKFILKNAGRKKS
ncbi:MAG: Holliday junction branch migration protein RuvA [Magnetococcus sp. WYHC-3]